MPTEAEISTRGEAREGAAPRPHPHPDADSAANGAPRPGAQAWHRQGIQRVIMKMRERLDDPPSLDAMAELASISPFHFDRVFRRIIGIPPRKFLGALRLREAKRLLVTTRLTVTDICYGVGYNSHGTFTSRFTQLVGLPPRVLRRLARNSGITLDSPPEPVLRRLRGDLPQQAVTGQVYTPEGFSGIVFVGLFPDPIPQGIPVGCDLLTAGDEFSIAPVDDGCYYIFAAAFPWREDLLRVWEDDARYVGSGAGPVLVRDGAAKLRAPVMLRSLKMTDPPILISLPYLLTKLSLVDDMAAV